MKINDYIALDEGKWDYPKDIKGSATDDDRYLGKTDRKRAERKAIRKAAKATAHKELMTKKTAESTDPDDKFARDAHGHRAPAVKKTKDGKYHAVNAEGEHRIFNDEASAKKHAHKTNEAGEIDEVSAGLAHRAAHAAWIKADKNKPPLNTPTKMSQDEFRAKDKKFKDAVRQSKKFARYASSKKVDEAPMGMIKKGITKLASKIPGSLGAKAAGSLQTGEQANAMYKEFYNYLGKTGQKPTTASVTAFLKSKGVSDDIIKKHVTASATAAPKYPTGGAQGGQAPAQGGANQYGAMTAKATPAPAKAAATGTMTPPMTAKAAPTAQPAAQQAPAAPTKDDWAARRKKAWGTGLAPGVHKVRAPTGAKVNEDVKLKKLLSKIDPRL